MKEAIQIENDVLSKVVERAKNEGLDKDERLNKPGDRFFNDLRGFSIYKLAYYLCFKCKTPYFGGMKDCNQAQDNVDYKPEELVCAKCAAKVVGAGIADCPKHGTDYIEFKCKFCCTIAQWFCFGTTHFCEPCHAAYIQGNRMTDKARHELPLCKGLEGGCPLKTPHPPNGDEYALGCGLCTGLQKDVLKE